jgi:oligosaccharide repeat unit polymerase
MSTFVPAAVLSPRARVQPGRKDVAFLPLHIAVTALVVTLSLGSIGLWVYEAPESHTALAIVTGIAGLGLIAYSRYFLRLPWGSAPVLYLILFWTFHFGMTFTAVLVPSVLTKIPEDELEWFYQSSTRMSMLLSVVGAASFVLAIGFFARRVVAPRPIETLYEPALYIVGWSLLLIGSALLVLIFAQNGGPAVFSMDVLEFRATILTQTVLPTAIDIAQLGCLLAICGGARRWPWPLLMWAVAIAVPMMLVGLRSAAMVPLVTYAAVLAYRGVRIRRSMVAAAVLGSLIAIPAISVFRLVGFSNRDLVNWTEVTPLDTFMELGGSLQATRAYVDWIEDGDTLLLGASYWAPFDRQILTRVIPGRELIPYEDDERVPLRLMVERESAVGGSAVGEAYYNFGSFGPVIYFLAIGVLFGLMQRFHASPYGSAMLGMLIMPLYFNIRSDWLSVPAQIGQGLALVAFCYVLARIVFVRALAGSPEPAQSTLTAVGR